MQKSTDLWNIIEVANYFGVSAATIRRKVKKSRENGTGFILPLFSAGSRLLWRKSDIEAWQGEGAVETVMFSPSVPSTPQPQMQSQAQVQRELQRLGVRLSKTKNN